ncbi:MAG TPA: hypothetical protein VGC81_06960 [Candidatus Methylomirabilis sp.]
MIENWHWILAAGLGGAVLAYAPSWFRSTALGRLIGRNFVSDQPEEVAPTILEAAPDNLPLRALSSGILLAVVTWALLGESPWGMPVLAVVAGGWTLLEAVYRWSRLTPELGQDKQEHDGAATKVIFSCLFAGILFVVALLSIPAD